MYGRFTLLPTNGGITTPFWVHPFGDFYPLLEVRGLRRPPQLVPITGEDVSVRVRHHRHRIQRDEVREHAAAWSRLPQMSVVGDPRLVLVAGMADRDRELILRDHHVEAVGA